MLTSLGPAERVWPAGVMGPPPSSRGFVNQLFVEGVVTDVTLARSSPRKPHAAIGGVS